MNGRTVVPFCHLAVLLLIHPGMEANQIVLPGSIGVSASAAGIGSPAAAFNSVDKSWLVVWRQATPGQNGVASIQGRVIREDRTPLTSPFLIFGDGVGMGPPRVAHDPLKDEWMVVAASGGSPFEPPTGVWVLAILVNSAGVVEDPTAELT